MFVYMLDFDYVKESKLEAKSILSIINNRKIACTMRNGSDKTVGIGEKRLLEHIITCSGIVVSRREI